MKDLQKNLDFFSGPVAVLFMIIFDQDTLEYISSRTGTGRSELAISVGRKQLGAQLECKADNEAVPSPLTSAIQVLTSI